MPGQTEGKIISKECPRKMYCVIKQGRSDLCLLKITVTQVAVEPGKPQMSNPFIHLICIYKSLYSCCFILLATNSFPGI